MPEILVVDDSEFDLAVVKNVFRGLGDWRAEYVNDGERALVCLNERRYDLILTDLHMPQMSGLELLKAVREQGINVPVVVMSAKGSEEAVVKALRLGAANYVIKKRIVRDLPGIIVATHDDITRRRNAEFQLQESHRLLETLASTDGLTEIANRRRFDHTLEQEWKRHNRTQSPLTLAMLDIDCFKQYNDQFGHLEGDKCLKAVAQAIQSKLRRPGDFVARYGGEEFAVILTGTDVAGAILVLKNVLFSVCDLAIPHPTSKVSRGIVTISIGCATSIPCDHHSPSDLLHRADQALYDAKTKGRDQLSVFEPGEWTSPSFGGTGRGYMSTAN